MAGIYINIAHPDYPLSGADTISNTGIVYAAALCKEISFYAPTHGKNETIEAIQFGGRPEYIGEEGIRSVVGVLFSSFDALHVQEFSINLEPGAFDLAGLQGLVALGFNTLNINAGSFFEQDLAALGRSHTPEDIFQLADDARKAGFPNLSITLDMNVPDQPMEYWAANLEKALRLGAQHISMKGMPIYSSNFEQDSDQLGACFSYPSEELEQIEKMSFATEYLEKAGMAHYVISAFARLEHESRLRQLQLLHGNILGIGPDAHSFWWINSTQANRWSNVGNIPQYKALLDQKELPVDARSTLNLDTLANEYIFLRVQHPDGLDLMRLESEYGVDMLSENIEDLAWLESEGYIEPIRNNRVRLSSLGKTHSQEAFYRLLT